MVDVETQEIFSEVNAFLEIIGEEYRNKIPKELIKMFKSQKSKQYNPIIDTNIPITQQNLKKETLAMIAMIDLKYWCDNQKKKREFTQKLIDNKKRHQEELIEKYNPNDIFKNNEHEEISINNTNDKNIVANEIAMIKYKEPVIKKIIYKIKNIIQKFKR